MQLYLWNIRHAVISELHSSRQLHLILLILGRKKGVSRQSVITQMTTCFTYQSSTGYFPLLCTDLSLQCLSSSWSLHYLSSSTPVRQGGVELSLQLRRWDRGNTTYQRFRSRRQCSIGDQTLLWTCIFASDHMKSGDTV